jgi:plastocyanin
VLNLDRALATIAAGLIGAAALLACGDHGASSSSAIREVEEGGLDGDAAAAVGIAMAERAGAGAIAGSVKWEGERPEPKRIDVSGNPDCLKISTEPIYEEHLVINPNGTVRNCVLWIDDPAVQEPPAEEVVVDQKHCRYVPHVFAVQVGQKLRIKSADPIMHNVHYIPTGDVNEEDNFSMLAGSPDKLRTFVAPDWIKFKCDVHPWMTAWCAVRPNRYFAITGDDGTFTIRDVPAGSRKLVLKHERLGERSATVEVQAGGTTTQDFTLAAKK